MTTPTYRVGEILDVALPAVRVTSVTGAESGEIEILLKCPSGGLYRTDIPLNVAGIRRVTPADGLPQPGEIWRDEVTGTERYACRDTDGCVLLRDPDGDAVPWGEINIALGPLTRVYAPATDTTTGGQADPTPEKTPAPRLMRGDVWRGDAGADWRVVEQGGALGLRFNGVTREWGEVDGGGVTWEWGEVDHDCGPLTLVQRAGCRRTETTVPVWQLKPGQVVSHSDWADGAPVRFFEALDDVRDLKITCRPLGWISKITFPAARDAEATLWTEIDGGAR